MWRQKGRKVRQTSGRGMNVHSVEWRENPYQEQVERQKRGRSRGQRGRRGRGHQSPLLRDHITAYTGWVALQVSAVVNRDKLQLLWLPQIWQIIPLHQSPHLILRGSLRPAQGHTKQQPKAVHLQVSVNDVLLDATLKHYTVKCNASLC